MAELTDRRMAEMIRDGDLPSPQRFGDFWLFDLRVTGTGVAYRDSRNEFSIRDPKVWLTKEQVERCNGLPVTFGHPGRAGLNTQEFRDRSIGSVMLPYMRGDEIRGVAKIFDDDAALLMRSTHRSTSPGVMTPEGSEPVELPDGSKVLDEDVPIILDHLAICEAGVWDKGGPPTGVRLDARRSFRGDDGTNFVESDHPRDSDGKFTDGAGSSSAGKMSRTKVENGKRVTEGGKPLPAHVESLKIPPAWTDVEFSEDSGAKLLAVGKDSKGRRQAIYSKEFADSQAAKKFARIKSLSKQFPDLQKQNANDRASEGKKRDNAACCWLIMEMGVRPGSDEDTGAKVKAYGATTLEGRHVSVEEDGSVRLKFTGKKGVSIDLPVENPELATMLKERAKTAGEMGRLFGSTNDKSVLEYSHTLDDGAFKTKDFRTRLGTSIANKLVQSIQAPTDEKTYRKAVMDVAKRVSEKLGNTPVIALQSYIAPEVFAPWRIAA